MSPTLAMSVASWRRFRYRKTLGSDWNGVDLDFHRLLAESKPTADQYPHVSLLFGRVMRWVNNGAPANRLRFSFATFSTHSMVASVVGRTPLITVPLPEHITTSPEPGTRKLLRILVDYFVYLLNLPKRTHSFEWHIFGMLQKG